MMIFRSILQSCKRSLKGEEKLWIVFWLWGVALYISSISIGLCTFSIKGGGGSLLGVLMGISGLILIFIYPFMFCVSLWRCSKNTKWTWCKYLARLYAVAFIPAIHVWISAWIFIGSLLLMGAK
jgi:hypothetical protein